MGDDDRLPFMQQEAEAPPQDVGSGKLIIKAVGALALVIALLFVGSWTLRKLGFGNKKAAASDEVELAVVSSIAMGSGRTISTIQFGDRVLLVGATSGSFTLLAEHSRSDSEWERPHRSVADLLADGTQGFEDALAAAEDRWDGRIYQ